MKTILPINRFFLPLLCIYMLIAQAVNSQTYTTIANGLWNLPTTWKNGLVPPANVPAGAVVNVKHIVTYVGLSITNSGIINLSNDPGSSPRLLIPTGVSITNNAGGKIYVSGAELRQYRFAAGLETGVIQTGSFVNDGGYVQITDSWVEIAENWTNDRSGTVVFRNSSLAIGRAYEQKSSSVDTIEFTSISVGMHGSGDFTADGLRSHYVTARFQVASSNGKFNLKSGSIEGSIDYITMKNHISNTFSSDKIIVDPNILTKGLFLNSYCIGSQSNFNANGKLSGPRTAICQNYFPASLFGSMSNAKFNFSSNPTLISGSDLAVGAIYKYEGVIPGVDAVVKVDSLVGGATITKIDNNASGAGFIEGFQPEIKSSSARGESYVVFTIQYKVAGTSIEHKLNTFSITALDIDGTNTIKEFDQIDLGPGSSASYKASTANINLTQVGTSAYRGINTNGRTVDGVDTTTLGNMFTVTNSNVSSFTLKLGVVKNDNSSPARMFGLYMKGFVYPNFSTLPVKLESFTAQLNNDKADLKWISSYEKDVNYFSVEKSLDGKEYKQAGIVFAIGNSSTMNSYTFLDENIDLSKPGVIYYRLRSVDIDGSYEYSTIRMITIGNQNKNALSVQAYPNPVSNELRVTIPLAWQNKKVNYELIGNNGLVIKKVIIGNASQTEAINVQSLAPGFYVVAVSYNGERIQQKVIKR
jgi:hypothetical protein